MANPKLVVEVAGDARKLNRTLKQTETQTQAWARRMSSATGSSSLGILGGKGFLGAAAVGVGVASLKSIINASANAQQVLGQTRVALEDSGLSWSRYGDVIQKVVASQSRLGFDDEEQLKAISTFARATGDVSKALDLTALSADVARGRYIDLASASNIVLKAQLGNAGALRRIGIDARKGASSIELLTLLTQKYGGSAEAAMGDATTANERLKVSLDNVKETLGSGALPLVSALANAMSDAADSASILADKAKGLGLSFDFPTKSGKLLGHTLSDYVTFYPILKDVLGGTKDEVDKLGTSLNTASSAAQGFKVAMVGLSGGTFGVTPLDPLLGKKPATKGSEGQGVTAEQRNNWFDSDITRRLDKVQDIGTVKGQISALTEIGRLIEQRIKATKDITRKLNLEDQLRFVNRQKSSLGEQLVADAAEAKLQQKALAEQRAAARLAQVQARQFRAIGLAADGSEIVPGVDNLKKRLAQLKQLNVSAKVKSQLEAIGKVLSGSLGKVSRQTREAIDGIFDNIADGFNQKGKGPLTKTSGLDTKKILEGLGLSPADEAELRSRLSNVNSAGRVNAGGTGSRTQTQVVESHITVLLDSDVVGRAVTRSQQKAKKRNPAQRRGPNRGK